MEESLLTNSNNKYKIPNNQLDSQQNSYYDKSKFQNNYSNYYQSNGQDGYYIQSLRSQNVVDRNEMQFLLMLNQLIIIITMFAENQFDYDQFSKITEIQNDNEKEENLTDQDIKYQQYDQKFINDQKNQKQNKNSEKEVEQKSLI
ncbi:hypothetical protein PPERSA_12798 [Pseudocohnilembus persalinus]|uniref:Uncharacterized protein n=1 Tax=Pseudocohnilembus persalinus TaxID=266149 RepID=A0A0V0QEI9_PSEPJ|nr:hypothetical protein PPERSA_12798 [Pseudocohnilembus persalinus]|eukprot:KRX00579.1 hypothetical protein PPERSA_12798 [Pseudocohnilembus persalinus]